MAIHIGSAEGLPPSPVSYQELDKKCTKTYTKFKFFEDSHIHRAFSSNAKHGYIANINAKHVILPGLFDAEKLLESLTNQLLQIEVHDRDLASECPAPDRKDAYGVASFDLSELAQGATQLEMSIPILPANNRKEGLLRVAQGHWLESNATLSVRISLKYPLQKSTRQSLKSPNNTLLNSSAVECDAIQESVKLADDSCMVPLSSMRSSTLVDLSSSSRLVGPFARIFVLLSSEQTELARDILQEIGEINSLALFGVATKKDSLIQYRLTPDERKSPELDIITGYHIYDQRHRIIMVEGVKTVGLKRLADSISTLLGALKAEQKVQTPLFFYDPYSSFASRIWAGLDANIVNIKIENGISEIMKKTSSYVRKSMNRECFDCLNIFNQMIAAGNTKDTLSAMFVGKSLFSGVHCPTGDMINVLKYTFGSSVDAETSLQKPDKKLSQLVRKIKTQAQKSILKNPTVSQLEPEVKEKSIESSPKLPSKIQLAKRDSAVVTDVTEILKTQQGIKRRPNFVSLYASQFNGLKPPSRLRNKQSDRVFNYSIQEVSSTNYQMQQLREDMVNNPSTFYTYGSEYLSQTVPPIDVDEEKKKEEIESQNKWMSSRFLV